MMVVKHKNLLVMGLGKTGISVIEQIKEKAGSIIAVDDDPCKGTGVDGSKNLSVVLGKKGIKSSLLDNIQLVIVSPGVPCQHPVIVKAREMNIPVWSEIELAWNLLSPEERKNTIAVTGTNGKTTTVNIMGKILEADNVDACICGNVGYPLIDTIYKKGLFRIIEVSSFQLEWVENFAPHIGVLLNISSDHLDRHRSMNEYAQLKFRLFMNQSSSDFCILNADDKTVSDMALRQNFKSRKIKYGWETGLDVSASQGKIVYCLGSDIGEVNIGGISLEGSHNTANIMACVAAAKLLGIRDRVIENSLKQFKPIEHRIEYAGTYRGIACYNDSKSTNPHATIAALNHFSKPLTLILGGKDKGMDLDNLLEVLDRKVAVLILIGQSGKKIMETLAPRKHNFKIHMCSSLKEAVKRGMEVTPRGGIFLLSPAFASMDMFKDYQDRGNQFKSILRTNGYGN